MGEVDGGGELSRRETTTTPVAQLIPPARRAQGPTKLPKLPKHSRNVGVQEKKETGLRSRRK